MEDISKQIFHDDLDGTCSPKAGLQVPGLPDVTGQTEAARKLRCLVVQSQIFEILQRRIFEPFLFTTAYDGDGIYGVGDSLSMISGMIRAKSVNREQVWRSITMRCIYGSAYGRRAVAAVAGRVGEEIMARIQPLVSPTTRSLLSGEVRLVVKAAVELWRRCRLEWDWIHSTMPSMADWKPGMDTMFCVRPRIVRERMGSLDSKGSNHHGACVYLQGTGIREDSPLVIERRQELRAKATG